VIALRKQTGRIFPSDVSRTRLQVSAESLGNGRDDSNFSTPSSKVYRTAVSLAAFGAIRTIGRKLRSASSISRSGTTDSGVHNRSLQAA